MDALTLARYEVQGNDFLIAFVNEVRLVSLDRALAARGLDRAAVAQSICDRAAGAGTLPGIRHTRGADGFIIGVDRSPHESVRMHLLNSDGSFAETSGNGLACLAQAAFDAGLVPTGRVEFESDAGRQVCEIDDSNASRESSPDTCTGGASRFIGVEMRSVTADRPVIDDDLVARIRSDLGDNLMHFRTGDVGNPHLVIALRRPIDEHQTAELGAAYESHFPDGINVEFVWISDASKNPSEDPRIVMSVWERGAGLTLSCGTGSVVAATFAHRWGMAGSNETVHMETAHMSPPFQYFVVADAVAPQLHVFAERIETDISFELDSIEV